LLQLTDVLDAEAALAGARALLLRTQYDVRIAAAELQLALGQPIEGVN
jgi:outer membrane protein TolC